MRGLLIACVLLAPMSAEAFSYESALSKPCHENITLTAFDEVREDGRAPVIAPTGEEQAMLDDLPFTLGPDRLDLVPAALVIGVRDPDLKGRGPAELDQLAFIHGDPDLQAEHCLRRPEHDEPNGSELALAECRIVIYDRFIAALEGLGPDGLPDPNKRIDILHTLAVRGPLTSNLPLFWVELGRAVHTLQDAYSHTFRVDDGQKVTVSLNWVDFVEHRLIEEQDGPQHIQELDKCDDQAVGALMRHTRAAKASEELIRLAVEPIDRTEKLQRLSRLLDEHLGFRSGCQFDNGWCDAPEMELKESLLCGCNTAHHGSFGGGWLVLALLLLLRVRRPMRKLACNSLSFVLLLAAVPAFAEESKQDAAPEQGHGDHGPEAVEIPGTSIMLHVAAGASFDNPALAGIVAGRYRFGDDWLVGVDLEWNPWIVPETRRIRAGTANVYATLIRQFKLSYEDVHLRTTVNAGTSILLTDLVGAPAGHAGILLGVSVLGVEWRIAKGWYMVFDPAHLIVPIPQIKGAPFGYPQYRFTLGLQFGG